MKFTEVLGIVGLVLISFGSWCIYHPAGYIVLGASLVGIAVLAARNESE